MLGNVLEGLIGRLAWLGLLHATWLGLAVPASLVILIRLRPRMTHRGRHAWLLAALALIAAGPVGLTARQFLVEGGSTSSRRPGGTMAAPARADAFGLEVRSVARAKAESPVEPGPVERAGLILDQAARAVRSARPFGLLAWSSVALVLGLRLAAGGYGTRRWVRRSSPAPRAIVERSRAIGSRLGLGRVTEVRVHPGLAEPCLCGLIRPMVLLPGAWLDAADPGAVDAVLAHELAHARRLDPWINLGQRLVEVALFFHPAVLRLSAALRFERELCADALGVRATGDPLSLAMALESVARFRLSMRPEPVPRAPSLAFGGDGSPLLTRIQELIGMTPQQNPRASALPLAAAPLALGFALLAAAVGLGQQPKGEPTPMPTPASPTTPRPVEPANVEPPMITYEVRFVTVRPGTIQPPTGALLKPITVDGDMPGWTLDKQGLYRWLTESQQVATSNILQAPKVTGFADEQLVITTTDPKLRAEPNVVVEAPMKSGHFSVGMRGRSLANATRLVVNVKSTIGDHPPAEKRARVALDLPEDSSLVVQVVRNERKVEGRVVVDEIYAFITPRRIIPEQEERRVGDEQAKANVQARPNVPGRPNPKPSAP